MPFSFVNISLLGGATLVALPVLLHLVMRQKPRRLEFPALQFIQRRHDTNRRQLRLRHLVLLLLRMALVALLAFALARPSMKVAGGVLGGQKEPVAAILVFDTSKRMEYRHENQTRLEAAQLLGQWLLAQLPVESTVAVLDSRGVPAAFQVDLGAAKDRVERLETVGAGQSLSRAMEEGVRLAGTSPLARKELYVFTDLAQVAWPAEDAARLQEQFRTLPDVGVYVIDVGIAAPTNFALGDLRLSKQVLSSRGKLRITTDLSSIGGGGKRTVELYLLESEVRKKEGGGAKPTRVQQKTVVLEAGQAQELEFDLAALPLGTHQGDLQVLGEDGLLADNQRFFTVEVRPPRQVLVAAGRPGGAANLTQALAPDEQHRRGEVNFECKVIAQERLLAESLDPYAAIAILDPKPMGAAVWQTLGDFVAGGRGLALFLGRSAEPVEAFNQGPAQELLPGKLVRKGLSQDQSLLVAPRDFQHPILAEFRGRSDAVPWRYHPVYRYWQLSEPPTGVHVVAPYSNDDPAILERPVGRGRVVTMTTPISDDLRQSPWNLLPGGWPFLVLVNTTMEYLSGGGGPPLNYGAGQTAILELDPQRPFRSYVLTMPDGMEVRLTPDLKDQSLLVTATEQAGNYRVRAGGTADGVDRGISVNLAASQTRLERISSDDLAKRFGPVPYRVAQSKEEIELNVSTGRVGRELYPLLILAMAVCLALEQIVANRFYREG